MKAYLANSLFSEADRRYNAYLAYLLRREVKELDLFVPQETPEINDKSVYADSLTIAQLDTKNLLESDILIAVIDGVEIDSGVSCEIGIFSTTKRPIIALYTDTRQQGRNNHKKIQALINDGAENQFMYRNLFTIGKIKENGIIVSSVFGLLQEIARLKNS